MNRGRIAFFFFIPLGLTALLLVSRVRARESGLSAAVAFVSETPAIKDFLDQPGVGYVQAYFAARQSG